MTPVGLSFGDDPSTWDKRLLRLSPWVILFVLLPYAVAVMQMPRPADAIPVASARAALAGASLALAVMLACCAAALLHMRRASGVLLLGAVMTYLCPMLLAVAIATGPMDSGGMLLATLALSLWSLWRLWRADRRIGSSEIALLSRERIVAGPSGTVLLPSSAFENGGQLNTLQAQQGINWPLVFEMPLAVAVLAWLPGTLPLSADGYHGTYAGALPWLLCVVVLLLGRKSVNGLLLQWRAVRAAAR